jgi:hypothetical protein
VGVADRDVHLALDGEKVLMGQAGRRGRILGTPLRLERQASPFLLQFFGDDRDPSVGRPPVGRPQRPPDLGLPDQGAVPLGYLLPDPVDFCSLPFAFFGRMGVGILVVPIGGDPRCRTDGSRNAQKHC